MIQSEHKRVVTPLEAAGGAVGIIALVLLAFMSAAIGYFAIYSWGMHATGLSPYGNPVFWTRAALLATSVIAPIVSLFHPRLPWHVRLSIAAMPLTLALVLLGGEVLPMFWHMARSLVSAWSG